MARPFGFLAMRQAPYAKTRPDANFAGMLDEIVKSALQTHDSVLIVYGASHLTFEWRQLVNLMGKPVKTKRY